MNPTETPTKAIPVQRGEATHHHAHATCCGRTFHGEAAYERHKGLAHGTRHGCRC